MSFSTGTGTRTRNRGTFDVDPYGWGGGIFFGYPTPFCVRVDLFSSHNTPLANDATSQNGGTVNETIRYSHSRRPYDKRSKTRYVYRFKTDFRHIFARTDLLTSGHRWRGRHIFRTYTRASCHRRDFSPFVRYTPSNFH